MASKWEKGGMLDIMEIEAQTSYSLILLKNMKIYTKCNSNKYRRIYNIIKYFSHIEQTVFIVSVIKNLF